jgi:protein-S-isoprenylcysteine O-methyltransferase Ste14
VSVFLSEPGQIVFYTVLVVAFAIQIGIISIIRKRAPPLKTRSESKLSNPRIWGLNVPLGLAITLLLGYTQIGPLPDWSFYLGLSIGILGYALVYWGYWTLGQYFSAEVAIYQGQELVERGPYRFVRHPVYSGIFLAVIGGGFAVQSWAAVVLLVIMYAILFRYRIAAEEQILISEFGEQYQSYSKRVKRLIPFIY